MTEAAFPHLADVGFERVAPSPALRPFVQWYWQIESRGRIITPRLEFMHADGSVGLVFNWGDTLELNCGRFPQSISLDTISRQSKQLYLRGRVAAFGILFQPGGAFPLLGVPMPELVSTEAVLAQASLRDLPDLYEQLAEVAALQERIALVEWWLEKKVRGARPQSPIVAPSLAAISRANGQLAVPRLAEAVSLGQRQLERLYQEQVGLSPKKMAQLRRVRQARAILKQGSHSLTDIAYQCGFYDQAHFIREFKAVTGLTPGAYLIRQQNRQIKR